MKVISSKYLLQLAYNKIGEHTSHVCNKFSSANADSFMKHKDFIKLHGTGRLYYAQNAKGESWFLLLEPAGSSSRMLFAQIRCSIKNATMITKLEQRAGAHASKADKLWVQADAIKASANAPQVAITFDDELPF